MSEHVKKKKTFYILIVLNNIMFCFQLGAKKIPSKASCWMVNSRESSRKSQNYFNKTNIKKIVVLMVSL